MIDSINVEYTLYIANNKNKVSKYANCRLGEIASVNTTKMDKDGSIIFEVEVLYLICRIALSGAASIIKISTMLELKQLPTSQQIKMPIPVTPRSYVLFMTQLSSPAR